MQTTLQLFLPYAFPAILALLAKTGIFFYARYSKIHNLQTRLYLLFLFSLAIQNLAEIGIFANLANGHSFQYEGTLYFGASIPAIAFMLHLALAIGTNGYSTYKNFNVAVALLYVPAVVLEFLLWGSSLLIIGFQPMNYTITKIPGPFYFLFELYAFSYLCLSAGLLVYGAFKQVTIFRRLQNRLLLIGLAPWLSVVLAVVGLQRLGVQGFSATTTLPLAMTFFLIITAYATHQYRLFDIAFFIPWSKVRRRKTAFYERIKAMIAEIADMNSVNTIVQSLSTALHCPVVLIGGPKPAMTIAGEALGIARFPLEELRRIENIVVAQEIADTMPDTHALMKRHKVAAIVPFHPHSEAAASWMLLGESFSEHVYSSRDFQEVEILFARLADHFLDKQLLLRSQLSEARREMHALHTRLANAWGQVEDLRKKLREREDENRRLQLKNKLLFRHYLSEIELQLLDESAARKKSLAELNAEFEARVIEKALECCDGNYDAAADHLGLSLHELRQKMVSYGFWDLKNKE